MATAWICRDVVIVLAIDPPAALPRVDKFGERGAVDLTGVMGYNCFVSMMLNIDRYPLPDGDKPELKPLR